MLKRVYDVEWVLAWAFRDELPKRGSPESGPSGKTSLYTPDGYAYGPKGYGDSPLARFLDQGTSIDHTPRYGLADGPGMPIGAGAPHPDAFRVLDAVEALDGAGLDLADWSRGPGRAAPPGLDVDIMAAVAARDVVALVVGSGRSGRRPYWAPDQTVRAKTGANGAPIIYGKVKGTITLRDGSVHEVERDEVLPSRNRKGGAYPTGSYCKLVYDPGRVRTWEARAEYAAWRAAVDVLVERLNETLESIRVTASSAPRAPWDDPADSNRTGTIIRDDSCGGLVTRPPAGRRSRGGLRAAS